MPRGPVEGVIPEFLGGGEDSVPIRKFGQKETSDFKGNGYNIKIYISFIYIYLFGNSENRKT